jgi:hypothetical protein
MNVSTKLQSVVQEIEKVSTLPLYENCPINHCCYRVHLRHSHVATQYALWVPPCAFSCLSVSAELDAVESCRAYIVVTDARALRRVEGGT